MDQALLVVCSEDNVRGTMMRQWAGPNSFGQQAADLAGGRVK
jgi:hypothetical protein